MPPFSLIPTRAQLLGDWDTVFPTTPGRFRAYAPGATPPLKPAVPCLVLDTVHRKYAEQPVEEGSEHYGATAKLCVRADDGIDVRPRCVIELTGPTGLPESWHVDSCDLMVRGTRWDCQCRLLVGVTV